MKIILEHTNNEHCREVSDFKKYISENENIKSAFPLVEFETQLVNGSNYSRVKIYYDETIKTIEATRLDLVSNFLSEYHNVK